MAILNGIRLEARVQVDRTLIKWNRVCACAIRGKIPILAIPKKSLSSVPKLAINLKIKNVPYRLRTFIYDRAHQKYVDDIASRRKSLVSTGDRSAKIRTYNYPQGRVTDHRIGYTTHDLQGFVAGDIQAMIDALSVAENTERMKEAEL